MLFWFIVFWVVSGILHAGIKFAFDQREFPSLAKKHYWADLRTAYGLGLVGGPIILYLILSDRWILSRLQKNGVKFW